jgi:hypothetical protein
MTFNPDNPNEHTQVQDPYASADTAEVMARTYYGQIDIDAWFCALIKGTGKVPYDPSQHDRRATALDLSVLPLAEMNLSFSLERGMIAESKEWAKIAWASLKELGATNTRELKGQWCKATFVPTGRTYKNSAGEKREATTFKFLALYENEEACRRAFFAETGATPDTGEVEPIPGFEDAAPAASAVNDKERETAKQFVVAMAKQYNGDIERVHAWAQTVPMVTAHFGTAETIRELLESMPDEAAGG